MTSKKNNLFQIDLVNFSIIVVGWTKKVTETAQQGILHLFCNLLVVSDDSNCKFYLERGYFFQIRPKEVRKNEKDGDGFGIGDGSNV